MRLTNRSVVDAQGLREWHAAEMVCLFDALVGSGCSVPLALAAASTGRPGSLCLGLAEDEDVDALPAVPR